MTCLAAELEPIIDGRPPTGINLGHIMRMLYVASILVVFGRNAQAQEYDASAPATADTEGAVMPEAPAEPAATEVPADSGPKTVFGKDNPLDKTYDWLQGKKKEWHMPVSAAAWHWWHVNNDGPNGGGYGFPGLRGTYWYNINADPEFKFSGCGPIKSAGAHTELRLRDNDPFRSFFQSNYWFYEAYGFVQTDFGKIKGGKIWKRFGLDWDGPFWGNVPYFDGFKLDPDWGLSWEHTFKPQDRLSVDAFAQFFFHEDGVNGSFGGADPESVVGSNEENTGVVRVVPTWTFCDDSTLALGASLLVGSIVNDPSIGPDETLVAWALDATYTKGKWKFMGEVLQSYGVLNPVRYTSGGASDQLTDVLLSVHYQLGPADLRFSYSAGFDQNPSAEQHLFLPGATIALSKNVDLYVEYVREHVNGHAAGNLEFEDGWQFIVNWRF